MSQDHIEGGREAASETRGVTNDVAEQLREALEFILHEAEHPQKGPAWTSRKRIADRATAALSVLKAGAQSDAGTNVSP